MSDTPENMTLDDFGLHLRGHRQSAGLSVVELAKKTRIPLEQVEALENGQMVNLPPVTLKGFIRAYAVEVGLDPNLTANKYNCFLQDASDILILKPSFKGSHEKESGLKSMGLALLLIVLAGMVVAGFYAAPYLKGKIMSIVNRGPVNSSPAELAATGRPSENAPASEAAAGAGASPATAETPPVTVTPIGAEIQAPPVKPAAPDSVKLKLVFKKETWAQTMVDGGPLEHYSFKSGQEQTWVGRESIMVRLGNAGAVEAFQDGRKMPAWGPEGRVIEKHLLRGS